MTTSYPLPPGPASQFPFGHLPELRNDRLGFFQMCAHAYGDCTTIMFGPYRAVLVTHPDLIEDVLVTQSRRFIKHFLLRMNRMLFGYGLLSSEGEFWLRQRRLAQPAFHRTRVAAYGATMVASAERLCDQWRDGETRDLHGEMMQLTLEIVAKTLFNAEAGTESAAVAAALTDLRHAFEIRMGGSFLIPERVPTPNHVKAALAIRRIDKVVYGFIERGRGSGVDTGDLLSMLLAARDEDGSPMTTKQLRDEVMTLFLAGHETTALAVSWVWYLLATHADAEARLHEELDRVLGDRAPTMADLPQLRYTEMVVNETLRLYPPAYVIGREAIEECTIGGYRIPKGTTVLMSQWLTQRDGRFFAQPLAFRPERWADGLAKRLPKYAYFPFGGGQRVCIGASFALMEAILIVATIARRFRFDLVPDHPVVPQTAFTLQIQHGVRAIVRQR